VKVGKLDAHSNPLQTVLYDPNRAVEFVIGPKAQPQLYLLPGQQRILSLNKDANRADIRPAGRDLLTAPFEVDIVDQFDPLTSTSTGVGRTHDVPQKTKIANRLSILSTPDRIVQTDSKKQSGAGSFSGVGDQVPLICGISEAWDAG
jgi:hypothetical protein